MTALICSANVQFASPYKGESEILFAMPMAEAFSKNAAWNTYIIDNIPHNSLQEVVLVAEAYDQHCISCLINSQRWNSNWIWAVKGNSESDPNVKALKHVTSEIYNNEPIEQTIEQIQYRGPNNQEKKSGFLKFIEIMDK
jgi:hypothetical protein